MIRHTFACLFIMLSLSAFSQNKNNKEDQWGRDIIKKALAEKNNYHVRINKPIPDRKTAIEVAEPILFKGYGEDHIIGEKPYNVYSIDGYWILTGTLPKGYHGGTFLIILAAKDGRVIKIIHGK